MKYAIYDHQLINAKNANDKLNYECPFCHQRVTLHRATSTCRAFFAHKLRSEGYYNPGETREHLAGKQQLFNFFKTNANTVTIEKYLPQINQWPDLMVNNTVVEFQCSPISTSKLRSRIAGYSSLGLKSWWILGSPYYNRYLRPQYVARFINYSRRLGFFMLFWRYKRIRLEIHYRIRENGGRIKYLSRQFRTYEQLRNFLRYQRWLPKFSSRRSFVSSVNFEIKLYQRRLFHGDSQLVKIQAMINREHNSLMGCPVICHLPTETLPIFRDRALIWRLWIIILMGQTNDLNVIYNRANRFVHLPMAFCQIFNYTALYRMAFKRYIRLLMSFNYVRISDDGKKITRLKRPRWFNSYYDKLKWLRRNYEFK